VVIAQEETFVSCVQSRVKEESHEGEPAHLLEAAIRGHDVPLHNPKLA